MTTPSRSRGAIRPGPSGTGRRRRYLVVTLDAYRFSRRGRKSAAAYARRGPCMFLGLAAVGRAGRWDRAGSWRVDGIDVRQLPARTPRTERTPLNQVRNALRSYLPAYLRLAAAVLRTPADVVHVTGIPLALLGVLHKVRYASRFVVDVTERPGRVTASGSLAAVTSRFEPLVLRLCRPFVDVASVVVPADVAVLRRVGYQQVELVRNAPARPWRAEYRDPPERNPSDPVFLTMVGSIFEGRGLEMLIQALALARQAYKSDVRVRIVGPGRADYVDGLRKLTSEVGVDEAVEWCEPVSSDEVSEQYLRSHVGLVMYESADPGNDGLPNKLMECVSSGRPVLATDLPETRRFVEENNVGWPAADDVESFARALGRLRHQDFVGVSRHCRKLGDDWLNWEAEFSRLERYL